MTRAHLRQPAQRATVVVIGGGQAGLAASYELGRSGIDHVVLERGEVANSWRTERWDSLRLLTPNWQTALPGYAYAGADPHGFMAAGEVGDFICDFARWYGAPVHRHTPVTAVTAAAEGYRVQTTRGAWRCRAVVLASGPYNVPRVPAIAAALPASIRQLTAYQYRNPRQLADGGVLVVGASATGVQIAWEIQRSGRPVTLAAGEHVRMPRRYRGRDIQYWMHVTGLLDECYGSVDDLSRVRNLPSPQLIGHRDHIDLDLNFLANQGVAVVGRLVGARGPALQFSGALANAARMADLKLQRLLRRIDAWIETSGAAEAQEPATTPEPTRLAAPARLGLDLREARIDTVIWATGFRPDYAWLQVPVLDRKGRLQHDGGVTPSPGLYAMGLPFMRRRKSAFLCGVADDAADIARHVAGYVYDRYRRACVVTA